MVEHRGRVTVASPGDDANGIDAVFAEAAAKAKERDGIRLTVTDPDGVAHVFDLWLSRLTFKERARIQKHTGMAPLDVMLALSSGQGAVEMMAAVIAMARYQTAGKLPDMDGVAAWLDQAIWSADGTVDVETLSYDDPPDDVVESEGNDSGQD